MQKILFSLVILLTLSNLSFSQDTLLYLNGDKELIHNYKFDDKNLTLNYLNRKDKEKNIEYDYIFSVIDSTGKEKIMFKNSTIDNEEFSIEQMRSFINGEIAGRKYHKARLASVSGFVFGALGGALFASGTFVAPLIPAANSAVIGFTKVKDEKVKKRFPKYENNEHFIRGYKQTAKEKRTTNSLKGGVVGLIVGIVSVVLICK